MSCVIVLGMHRSGSSLVARIFHEWGVNMGEDLMKGDGANPEGFWENWDFVRFNNQLLSAAGGSWNYPVMINKPNPAAQTIINRNKAPLWGWKDNRTAFTFRAYEPYLQGVMFVRVKRDHSAIVKSLKRTHLAMFEEKDKHNGYLEELCGMHERAIDDITQGYPTLVVNYDDLKGHTFFNDKLKHF